MPRAEAAVPGPLPIPQRRSGLVTHLPRSLLWRTFILLAALVVATTAAWFEIFRAYEIEPRSRQVTFSLVSIVNLTRTALITSQPDRRHQLLAELADREGIQVYPSEPGERTAPLADRPLMRLVTAAMRNQLGENTRFASERDGKPGFWVTFHIDDDEYWVRVPRERVERRIALQWLGWGALALVLSLLAAYLIVSRLNRPLRALASAASVIGRGKVPEPVSELGPEEIRTLSRAFNQMSRDLTRLDADRALILAGVSHDLRTPLSRLRLGVEMSGGDAQLKEGMTADIEEMDRTINQFLDFARTDGGEALQPADLSAIAGEVVEHFRRRGKPVQTRLASVPELPLQVMSMHRVVLNLIDNALRYGGTEVSVTTRAENGDAVLEVADRGPGIPAVEVDRLKQPFTRLEIARSDTGGAGLGLAIVERVARAHGGSLDLLPREGGGLIARIRLPLAERAKA
jgi:two-component system osmolarity sensor histidine kinase EnvZ